MLTKFVAAAGLVMLLVLTWTAALALSPGDEPGGETLAGETEPLANALGSDRFTSQFFLDYVHSVIAKRD